MSYVILTLLFIAVFVFITWRIVKSQPPSPAARKDSYICPDCNDSDCECHKQE